MLIHIQNKRIEKHTSKYYKYKWIFEHISLSKIAHMRVEHYSNVVSMKLKLHFYDTVKILQIFICINKFDINDGVLNVASINGRLIFFIAF